MIYRSEVSNEVFGQIQSGRRQIEPRLNDDSHKKIRAGDMILFVNRQTKAEQLVKVVGLLRFNSFDELFKTYPAERFGGENQMALRRFYTAEQEAESGVLGIKVHVLKNARRSVQA